MRSTNTRILAGGLAAVVLGTSLYMSGCAGGYVSNRLTEPIGDGMLIMGSVIVENIGYRNLREYYVKDIEVSIMGDQEIEGRMVRKAITIFADENGYFCVENVPQGIYTLKGIRIISPGGNWTIYNELRMPNERWMAGPQEFRYPFTGEYFHFTPVMNVYNFMHNVFSMLPGSEVRHANRPRMREESFYLNDAFTRDFIESYYLEKFPESGWAPILRELLPDIPPK
jgi:hypothetical protein